MNVHNKESVENYQVMCTNLNRQNFRELAQSKEGYV